MTLPMWQKVFLGGLVAVSLGCGSQERPAYAELAQGPAVLQEVKPRDDKNASSESGGFVFPTDRGGNLLAERLVPPIKLDVEPIPYVREPKHWANTTLDRPPEHGLATVPDRAQHRLVPQDQQTIRPGRHSLDQPALPIETELSLPARLLSVSSLSLQQPTNPAAAATVWLPLATGPVEAPSDVGVDPVQDLTRQFVVTLISHLRRQPVPFVRLAIPDPTASRREFEFRSVPADSDAPAWTANRPDRPVLPLKP